MTHPNREERLALAALFVNQLSDSDVRSIAVHASALALSVQDSMGHRVPGHQWYADRVWAALDALIPSPAWHLRKLTDQTEAVARTHHADVFGPPERNTPCPPSSGASQASPPPSR